ncbi:MAG: DUF2326 domain-containing protein, partial [Myxococcota bacterium]
MKLVALYSDNPELFPDIQFREGFNVVFAQVTDPYAEDEDAHNLGKTFLITVIDFALLGGIDRHHPFRKSDDLFGALTFYIELETFAGQFITVRRSVTGSRTIYIEARNEPAYNLRELADEEWTHQRKGEKAARGILGETLNLSVIAPYPYRKGLGYVLRRQQDYDEVFRISKFGSGRDVDWKPFMALMLGLDYDLVKRKYDLDAQIEEEKEYLGRVRAESETREQEYDAVRGQIEVLQRRIGQGRAQINTFSFREVEETVSQDVIDRIEAETAHLNEKVYTLRYELGEVRRSLETGMSFDLSQVETVFREAGIAFGDAVTKSYEELIDFNRRLAKGRSQHLRQLVESLVTRIEQANVRLTTLNAQRQRALTLLTEQKTFQKYIGLQERVTQQEKKLASLMGQLETLDHAATLERRIRQLRSDRDKLADEIRGMMREPPELYRVIRQTFATYAEDVLNVSAILHVEVNQNGNLDFGISILENSATRRETSEGRGTSYLKMLCVCFDLALLRIYSEDSFYRFVYHDGVFEGLDDRRKVKLLNLVRQLCNEQGIQYILTVIDSDIPRNPAGDQLLFGEEEIIRRLHDGG